MTVCAGIQIRVIGKVVLTSAILETHTFKRLSPVFEGQSSMEAEQRKAVRTLLKDLLLNDEGIQGFVRDIRVSSHDPYRVFTDIVLHNKPAQDNIGWSIETSMTSQKKR